ncbi:signal peptidase I [Nesterenkonia sp. F]|uniref:signal peptidase I n=1 Tax=Nesterenkonia sp. F TaxID=795955 RepID=UPI000255D54C|nr:signal peptidase I [Nesterenkonia sp. F]
MKAPQSPERTGTAGAPRGSLHAGRLRGRRGWITAALVVVVLAAVVSATIRGTVVDVYAVDQHSMHPTLQDGERVLVDKRLGAVDASGALEELHRGDVVVFDGTGSFAPYESQSELAAAAERVGHWFGIGSPPATYVKRVIGLGGDVVACCDAAGRVTVDGEPLEEDYLPHPVSAERPASEQEFEIEVPPGRMWVMGDHRSASVDSRALIGAPGGGMISQARVIGRVTEVVWPWDARRPLGEAVPEATSTGPSAHRGDGRPSASGGER